jgi:hypothetical protein
MGEDQKRCIGKTKMGKACNKFPIKGEEYCEKHNPGSRIKRSLRNSKNLNWIQFAINIFLGLLAIYFANKSEQRLTAEFKRNSFAERILSNQYNPSKLVDNFREFYNLMNNDPGFKKNIVIDDKGVGIAAENLIYNENFKVAFKKNNPNPYDEFVKSGKRIFTINNDDYTYAYIIKNGVVADSFCGSRFTISRNFPTFPKVNISTLYPTGEYYCTSNLDIQVDSLINQTMYMSNWNQNSTFKIILSYDSANNIVSYDQMKGISFDEKSVFYSIDQEISYYEFLKALYSNAMIVLKDANTGDTIHISEPYLPINMDGGRTINSINNKLQILYELKIVENKWRINFTRSDIDEEELYYLMGINYSMSTCATISRLPLEISIPNIDKNKNVLNVRVMKNNENTIVCDSNVIRILDNSINLGRLVVKAPPSDVKIRKSGDRLILSITPLARDENILFEFVDLKDSPYPDGIIYGLGLTYSKNPNLFYLRGIEIGKDSWSSIKKNDKRLIFDERDY